MRSPVYLGIDLGTQSVRIMAVTEDGAIAAAASHPLTSMRDGIRHEQSPEQWWAAVAICARSVMQELGSRYEVKGLAVDATSGTVLLIDDQLRPLTAGLMYDDGRAGDETIEVNRAGEALWRELSYRMQPSWALPKLVWLSQNNKITKNSRLAHQNDFIHARLAGHILAGDSSNSLKTGFDLIRMHWPWEILGLLALERELFPEVVLPGTRIGEVCTAASDATHIPAKTPIFAGMTDGCAAQIASGATTVGSWNSVIGTTLVIKGVTQQLLHDPLGAVYSHRSADGMWLPGGASSSGAGIIAKEFQGANLDALNRAAQQIGPVPQVVYPLTSRGERYPFVATEAERFMIGQAASIEERYAATLQGVAFVERLAFDTLHKINAPTHGVLTISGGATKSETLNQIRATVMQRTLHVPCVTESAFGMAVLAAAHTSSVNKATEQMVHMERTIAPERSFDEYAEQYAAFVDELARRGWLAQDAAAFALAGVGR